MASNANNVNFGAFNAAVSVYALLFLAEQGTCTFVLSFVSFNVASEVTEIGRISVVMHVSD